MMYEILQKCNKIKQKMHFAGRFGSKRLTMRRSGRSRSPLMLTKNESMSRPFEGILKKFVKFSRIVPCFLINEALF